MYVIESFTGMSKNCDTNQDMENMQFHLEVAKIKEENSDLREEIEKLNATHLVLERKHISLTRQLEKVRKKYDDLQQECDELKILLDEVTKKEKAGNVNLKQSMKERCSLLKKLEAAELEAQEIASLKEKLEKVTNEKSKSMIKTIKTMRMLDEMFNKCESLQAIIKKLQEANDCLWETCKFRENMIQVLRETNRELTDENAELKSLIDVNAHLSVDRLSTTPNSDVEWSRMQDTSSNESNGEIQHDSLYEELKASGFVSICDKDNTINRQLEDQVHWYELEIDSILKQTESAFKQLVSMHDEECIRLCVTPNLNYTESSEKIKKVETLRQRIQDLLQMATVTPSRFANIGTEFGTQVRADSGTTENLREFSVFNFYDYLDYVSQRSKMVTSCDILDNKHDPFLSAKFPKIKIVPESSIIDPIVEALDEIVRHTANPHLSRKIENPMESSSFSKNRSIHTITLHQNFHTETAHVRSDILHSEGNFPLQTSSTIDRGSLQLPEKGKLSKRTSNKECVSEFTCVNIDPHRTMVRGCRRSKSEPSLLFENKPSLLRRSLNVTTSLEKMSDAVEIKSIIGDSISKEREQKIREKSPEMSNIQNLTSYDKYTFGGTYRSLNNSTDSSLRSMSLEDDSFLPGDLSLEESRQQQYLCQSVYLAPTRLKCSPSKDLPLPKEECVNSMDTSESVNSNNRLIDDTKRSEINLQTKSGKCRITENIEVDRISKDDKIKKFPEITSLRPHYLNKRSNNSFVDINNEMHSTIGETYLIDKLTVDHNDKMNMSSQRFSTFGLESFAEIHPTGGHSTPIPSHWKNKNFFMNKNGKGENSMTRRRRSSCESLIQRFVDLNVSNKKNVLFRIHSEFHLDKINNNDHDPSINSTDANNAASLPNKSLNYTYSSPSTRSSHTFTKNGNSEEYICNEKQTITTLEETKDVQAAIRENIDDTSFDCENHIYGFDKLDLANSQDVEELRDILDGMENMLEENDNVLQGNDFYTSGLGKSNIILNDVCQNLERKLTDSSQHEIVIEEEEEEEEQEEERKRAPVSYSLINILTVSPWRIFISCALTFILGYYIKDYLSTTMYAGSPYKWWSLEEMFSPYIPIKNTRHLPPV